MLAARRSSAAGLACQPRRLKLDAAGFVRPALLLGCSEKSPRQGARADGMKIDHPRGDRKVIGADAALIERWRESGGRCSAEPSAAVWA
jgi:hypothetical protein